MKFRSLKVFMIIMLTDISQDCFASQQTDVAMRSEYEQKLTSAPRNKTPIDHIRSGHPQLDYTRHSSTLLTSPLSVMNLSGQTPSLSATAHTETEPTQQAHLKKRFDAFIAAQSGTQAFKDLRDNIKSQIQKRLSDGAINHELRQTIINNVFTNLKGTRLITASGITDPTILHEMISRLLYHEVSKQINIGTTAETKITHSLVKDTIIKPYLIGTQQKIAPEFLTSTQQKINLTEFVQEISLAPNKTHFIITSCRTHARLYNIFGAYQDLPYDVKNIAWSPNSQYFIAQSSYWSGISDEDSTNAICLYTATGKLLWMLPKIILKFAWCPDSTHFAVRFADNSICLYNLAGYPEWPQPIENIKDISWRPDSQGCIMHFGDNTAIYYTNGQRQASFENFQQVHWNLDSTGFTIQLTNNAIHFYNAAGQRQQIINNVRYFYRSPDSQKYLIEVLDRTARLYNAMGVYQNVEFNNIQNFYWKPNSTGFIALSNDNTARLYDATGQQYGPVIPNISLTVWAPDSSCFVGHINNTHNIQFYSSAGLQQGPIIKNVIRDISWRPNSTGIIAQLNDNTIRFYTTSGQQQGKTIENIITPMIPYWSQNSQRFVALFDNNTAHSYSHTCEPEGQIIENVYGVSITDDGIVIFTHSNAITIQSTPQDAHRNLYACTLEQLEFIKSLHSTSEHQYNSAITATEQQTKLLNELQKNQPFIAQALKSNYGLVPYQSWGSWLSSNRMVISGVAALSAAVGAFAWLK
jgi:WD40 repeat protein